MRLENSASERDYRCRDCGTEFDKDDGLMNDTQGPDDAPSCLVCDAANTEEIVDGEHNLPYRCLDCGAEFDPTDGRVNIK